MSLSRGKVKKIAVFVSGNGTNLAAIVNFLQQHPLNADLSLVFSDNPDAYALNRAREHNIRTCVLEPGDFSSRQDYDRHIAAIMETEQIDLIVLAGFMLLLSNWFVNKFKNRIMNIHPSLLPAFKGMHGIEDAFNYGVKITGVTVHFVDDQLDHGPIILQKELAIEPSDTLDTLERKIHKIEHQLYPEAIEYYCQDRLKIEGRKVIVTGIEKE